MFTNPDLIKLFLYGAGIFLTIGGLYGLNKYMKASALRSHESVSMTLDDLDRMKETGLIEEEELRRIRRKVSERMLEASMPKASIPAEESLKRALAELAGDPPTTMPDSRPPQTAAEAFPPPPRAAGSEPAALPAEPSLPAPAPPPAAPLPPTAQPAPRRGQTSILSSPPRTAPSTPADLPSPERRSSGLPLDIDKLKASGAIDAAEYERLKAYFARRNK